MNRNIDTIGPRDTPPDDWWGDDAPDELNSDLTPLPTDDDGPDDDPQQWEEWQDNQ